MLTKERTLDALGILATASMIGVGLAIGGHFGETVTAGIGITLAGPILQSGHQKLKAKWLSSSHGILNHDIQGALSRAFVDALRYLEVEYSKLGGASALPKTQKESIETFFGAMREQAEEIFLQSTSSQEAISEQDVKAYLYGSPEAATDKFWDRIAAGGLLSECGERFNEFLRANLLNQVLLRFGEELKTDNRECNKAWRAFQRLILEGIYDDVKAVRASQDIIIRDLQTLEGVRQQLDQLKDTIDHRLPNEPFQVGLGTAMTEVPKVMARLEQKLDVVGQKQDAVLEKLNVVVASVSQPPDAPSPESKKPSQARSKVKLAQELVRGGKYSDGIKEMTEALAIARAHRDDEEEVEILLGLAILSSQRSGRDDREHYFQQAENKLEKLKSSAAKVIYFRAQAAVLEQKGDFAGAERAYRAALHCCDTEPEDEKGNLGTQGCIARSSFVHFLCSQKRLDEAQPLLAQCEEYADRHRGDEEGELFEAAREVGIHFSLDCGQEDDAIRRISELEKFPTTPRLASRIAGGLVNVANQASHRKAHRTALAAAEASVRLGHRFADDSWAGFLAGALYTEAMVLAKSGNNGLALSKAEALLDICRSPEDKIIRQATQQLMAEIRRCSGDSQTAVDLAQQALSSATGRPEEIAFTKLALARALDDNGQTEEALKQAMEAWTLAKPASLPVQAAVDFLSHVTDYASQLGATDDLANARVELEQLSDAGEEVNADKARALARVSANLQLRQRFLQVLQESEPSKRAGTGKCSSLAAANANVVRPLLHLWKEMPSDCLAVSYDFWGRGNFERMLLNARSFPNSFNVTLEVRSLDDVKRGLRLWGLYADFLILLWKGPTKNGLAMVPLPENYHGPGGWGYMVAAGTVMKTRTSRKRCYPAMAHVSTIPDEVATFLATDARAFIQSGRLVVVPAVGAGCINPGHGPFEQLLAEAANAIPSIRSSGLEGSPIGLVPHSPDAPFETLVELAETESSRLRKLRLLLLERSRQMAPDLSVRADVKTLSLEIDDALRDLEDRNNRLARKKGFSTAKEPLAGTTARFRSSGQRLAAEERESAFAPLLVLQSLGYGWRVETTEIPNLPSRFEPQEGDVVGTWLAPPSAGWVIPTVRVNRP